MAQESRVAVLGLGLIGAAWARHLHVDGVLAGCWNRAPKPEQPGFRVAPGEVVRDADVILICVADPLAVEAVLERIAPELGAGHLVVQNSTIDPASSRRLQAKVEATGAAYLECPFTGSKPAAEARQQVFFVGNRGALADRAEPVLARLSKARVRFENGSAACSLKLALNALFAIMAEGLGESLGFARAAGIDDDTFFECLRGSVGWSGLAALKEPKLRAGDFSPQFSVKHMHKDVRLALGAAGDLALPALAVVERQFVEARARGLTEADFSALATMVGK